MLIRCFRAPYLVVVKDRGQSIRFYRPAHIKLNPQSLHRFLKVEGYNETPLWTSAYGPGGSRYTLFFTFSLRMLTSAAGNG